MRMRMRMRGRQQQHQYCVAAVRPLAASGPERTERQKRREKQRREREQMKRRRERKESREKFVARIEQRLEQLMPEEPPPPEVLLGGAAIALAVLGSISKSRGWFTRSNMRSNYVYDRSLGGRRVYMPPRQSSSSRSRRSPSPVSSSLSLEKEGQADVREEKRTTVSVSPPPPWFMDGSARVVAARRMSLVTEEEVLIAHADATRTLRRLLDAQAVGMDWRASDIVGLLELSRSVDYRAPLHAITSPRSAMEAEMGRRNAAMRVGRGARDALFRFAVSDVAIRNAEVGIDVSGIGAGTSPGAFAAEFAYLLYTSEEATELAVTIVRAAVAARVKSLLLSCVASMRRATAEAGNASEAIRIVRGMKSARAITHSLTLSSLSNFPTYNLSHTVSSHRMCAHRVVYVCADLVRLLTAFPLEDTPETDMLVAAVRTSLSPQDRQSLLNLATSSGDVAAVSAMNRLFGGSQ